MKTRLVLSAFASLLLVGCNYSIDKSRGTDAERAQTDPNNPANMNFANVMQAAISTNCLECHSSPRNTAGVNLETYENVFSQRAAIAADVRSGKMPSGRAMPQSARTLLLAWIDAGAPRDSAGAPPAPNPGTQPTPTPVPTPPHEGEGPNHPANLNYQTVAATVLQQACVGCHSAPNGSAGVNLDSYESVFTNRARIASAVQSGYMPLRSTLAPTQKTLLLDWLAAGAPREAGTPPAPAPNPGSQPAPAPQPNPVPQPPCDDHRRFEHGGGHEGERCDHRFEAPQPNLEVNQ